MAWSARFLRALEAGNRRPRFLLSRVTTPEFPVGEDIKWSSHAEAGYLPVLCAEGSSYRAGALSLLDWSSTFSELALGARQLEGVELRDQLQKGQVLELKIGFPGWAVGAYETVFTGVVNGFARGEGERWVLTLRSAATLALTRLSTTDPALFFHLEETAVRTDYVAGSTTLDVDAVLAELDSDGGSYLVQVTPNDGDPFFLTATATSGGNQYTGVSTTGQIETTEADADAANAVKFCAYIKDNPVDVALKVLTSTGNAYNGDWDTLPLAWGLGLPVELVDTDDCAFTAAQVAPAVATPTWDVYATEIQDDGLTWLQGVLSPAGIFLTERQGKLTVRAATDPDSSAAYTTAIWDDELASLTYDTYNPDQPVEYDTVRWNSAGIGNILSDSEVVTTKPSADRNVIHLDYVVDDASDWRDAISDRLTIWSQHISEVVDLVAIGWRLAQLAPGDHLYVNSRHYRSKAADGAALPLLVLSVEPDWWGGTTRVRAAFVSALAEAF